MGKPPAMQSKWESGIPAIGGETFGKENTGQSRNLRKNSENYHRMGDLNKSPNFRRIPIRKRKRMNCCVINGTIKGIISTTER
ncbi:hypothetical protein U1Q18_009081 [Sarracenia purpurea var. burkii]